MCVRVCPQGYHELVVWLNKFCSFGIAAVVGMITGHGPDIDTHRRNQPNKSYVASIVQAIKLL